MVKGGYVPGRTHPTDRARGQTAAMPTAVAAARQSYADHPMVRLETAPPGPCHAVSLQETPSDPCSTSATVILEKRINRNEKQTNSVPTAPQDGWQKRRLYWLASGHCEPVPVAVLSPNPPMDGARIAEGGEEVTDATVRARIRVDWRLAGGLSALLGVLIAACDGCGERDGGIGHGKKHSRTGPGASWRGS